MIRIRKPANNVPHILQTKGAAARTALEAMYDAGTKIFPTKIFDSKIYGHAKVKAKLIAVQYGKCCFCEAKILHIGYGDVEHFRPKAGWVQGTEPLNKPGYYWLAYDWNNLFLSCQLCNQQYKKNYFPLTDPAKRALSHHDCIADEDPILIHLSDNNPEDFIFYKREIAVSINENAKGDATILRTGLNRTELKDHRREKLKLLERLYNLAKNHPATPPELKNQAVETVRGYYNDSQLDSTEYASMLRCFFKANPIANL